MCVFHNTPALLPFVHRPCMYICTTVHRAYMYICAPVHRACGNNAKGKCASNQLMSSRDECKGTSGIMRAGPKGVLQFALQRKLLPSEACHLPCVQEEAFVDTASPVHSTSSQSCPRPSINENDFQT